MNKVLTIATLLASIAMGLHVLTAGHGTDLGLQAKNPPCSPDYAECQ
ncbi:MULTISPECIES: hypothetical protein [unclassified Leptolyngbya]|nr:MULTISPECIES: hypothetical protein [unclassified Leptolyngbya]MBD1910508.1 hypothetical protein [Leptolyngbya sp. FACHB-8]MBD2153879.1 hypothetical protein [Leptolyngbya sp. FACHB-16]